MSVEKSVGGHSRMGAGRARRSGLDVLSSIRQRRSMGHCPAGGWGLEVRVGARAREVNVEVTFGSSCPEARCWP